MLSKSVHHGAAAAKNISCPELLTIQCLWALHCILCKKIGYRHENPMVLQCQMRARRTLGSTVVKPGQFFLVQAVISVIMLCTAVYIILSHYYESATKQWACGTVGTLLGYWLKN